MAVLRDGAIVGSDKYGGVFEGQIVSTKCGTFDCVLLTMRVPPGGRLVNGCQVGAAEALVDVSGVLGDGPSEFCGTCDVLGSCVGIRFRFVGALPYQPAS